MDPVYKGGPLGEPPAPSNLGGSSGKPSAPAQRPSESRPPAAFEGELSFFSLPELIQLVCTGGQDSEIDIITDGARSGSLLIRAGRVFRCNYLGTTGEAAFFQLARLRVKQYGELAATGAGPRFELEQAQAEVAGLTAAGFNVTQHVGVASVSNGDPADGVLQAGDRIVSVDGTTVTSIQQVQRLVQQHAPG